MYNTLNLSIFYIGRENWAMKAKDKTATSAGDTKL
jgi:hypothetical protein